MGTDGACMRTRGAGFAIALLYSHGIEYVYSRSSCVSLNRVNALIENDISLSRWSRADFSLVPAAKPATQAASQPQPSLANPSHPTFLHANHHKTAMPNLQRAAHYCIYCNCCLRLQFLSSTFHLPPHFQSNCYLYCTLLTTITYSYAYQLSTRHTALARESLWSRYSREADIAFRSYDHGIS